MKTGKPKDSILYTLSPNNAGDYGETILESVGKSGPIESSESTDGHPSREGLILPLKFVNEDSFSDGWPEAIHL